ncbi:hypothetical protein DIPPA_29490 [Diplonema papillatum]|nr:hypothetical protein DIPPA_29490 [Diplonema papillatum]
MGCDNCGGTKAERKADSTKWKCRTCGKEVPESQIKDGCDLPQLSSVVAVALAVAVLVFIIAPCLTDAISCGDGERFTLFRYKKDDDSTNVYNYESCDDAFKRHFQAAQTFCILSALFFWLPPMQIVCAAVTMVLMTAILRGEFCGFPQSLEDQGCELSTAFTLLTVSASISAIFMTVVFATFRTRYLVFALVTLLLTGVATAMKIAHKDCDDCEMSVTFYVAKFPNYTSSGWETISAPVDDVFCNNFMTYIWGGRFVSILTCFASLAAVCTIPLNGRLVLLLAALPVVLVSISLALVVTIKNLQLCSYTESLSHQGYTLGAAGSLYIAALLTALINFGCQYRRVAKDEALTLREFARELAGEEIRWELIGVTNLVLVAAAYGAPVISFPSGNRSIWVTTRGGWDLCEVGFANLVRPTRGFATMAVITAVLIIPARVVGQRLGTPIVQLVPCIAHVIIDIIVVSLELSWSTTQPCADIKSVNASPKLFILSVLLTGGLTVLTVLQIRRTHKDRNEPVQ